MSPSKDPTGQSVLQNKRPLQATRPIKSNRTTAPAIKEGIVIVSIVTWYSV